ncbi:MAG: hypothetical protein U0Y82_14455 [Thermoleophilia bacterium]
MTGQVAAAGVHCRSGSHVWRGPEQVTYTLGFRWCWAGGTIRSVRVRERFGDAEPGAFTASTALVGSGGVGSSYVSIGRQAHWHDFVDTHRLGSGRCGVDVRGWSLPGVPLAPVNRRP